MGKDTGGVGRVVGANGKIYANRSTMLADEMSKMMRNRPRGLVGRTRNSEGPTPKQREAYDARVKEWNRKYRKLSQQHKRAQAKEIAAFNARKRS